MTYYPGEGPEWLVALFPLGVTYTFGHDDDTAFTPLEIVVAWPNNHILDDLPFTAGEVEAARESVRAKHRAWAAARRAAGKFVPPISPC